MKSNLLLLIVFIVSCFGLAQLIVGPLERLIKYCAPVMEELYNEVVDYFIKKEDDENISN